MMCGTFTDASDAELVYISLSGHDFFVFSRLRGEYPGWSVQLLARPGNT
jgi:hypothetical protein